MKQRFWNLFLIPSTYGFLIWIFLLSLLGVGVIELDVSVNAMLIFGYVVVCFLVSNVLIRGHFYSIEIGKVGEDVVYDKSDHVLLALSTLLGFVGLFLYVYDFSASFGGIGGFFTAFFNDPLEIRALAEDSSSIGFQISYFSWLSIFYCLFAIFAGKASTLVDKFLFSLIGLFGFFLNLLFVDRTRPTILFLASALGFGLIKFGSMKSPFRFYLAVFLGPLAIFFAQALYTGKYDAGEGLLNNFFVYILGGFGYFSALMNDVSPDFGLARVFYPVAKIMEGFGAISGVPPQILEFREVPFLTNVGTFLEPLFSDGGLLFVFVGAPLIIFAIDLVSLVALRSRSVPGLFLWANLVLVSMFSFFVPKYNATYVYLFAFVFILFSFLRSIRPVEAR